MNFPETNLERFANTHSYGFAIQKCASAGQKGKIKHVNAAIAIIKSAVESIRILYHIANFESPQDAFNISFSKKWMYEYPENGESPLHPKRLEDAHTYGKSFQVFAECAKESILRDNESALGIINDAVNVIRILFKTAEFDTPESAFNTYKNDPWTYQYKETPCQNS